MKPATLSRFWRPFGPGMIVASSCVGGSHIIAATQAGALYGWQPAVIVLAANLFKYPFFRIAFDYAGRCNRTLLEGYADHGRFGLCLFLLFNLFATVVNIAGGTLLSAALLGLLLPVGLSDRTWVWIAAAGFAVLFAQRPYRRLDALSKAMMAVLLVLTSTATVMVWGQPLPPTANPALPHLWSIDALPFWAALTGWMPAPLELSVAASLWVSEKSRLDRAYRARRTLDFNSGYVLTVLLALLFMLLGMWTLYGSPLPDSGGYGFIAHFADLYTATVGPWVRTPVLLLALACIYGTTLTAIDGYSRCNRQALQLLLGPSADASGGHWDIRLWMAASVAAALLFITTFGKTLSTMLAFAMTASFLSAPVFAWLNLRLADRSLHLSPLMRAWAYSGWLTLSAAALLYLTCT